MAGALMKILPVIASSFLIALTAQAGGSLPPLHLQPEVLDMGTVKEGEEARATLFIRNNSDAVINIIDIQASCGCTVAEPRKTILAPGEFTELEVRTDTAVKQGDVKKWIRITDSAGHVAKATLKLNVEENPHMVRKGRGLFDGKCAGCHFDPVQGKMTGKAIYDAACAMCHGENGAGAYATALKGYEDMDSLVHLVSFGTGKAQMPGFAVSQGGPLTEKQVKILSRWLLTLD